jgi:hypothetical protein
MGMFVLLPNSANALAVFPAEASTSVVDWCLLCLPSTPTASNSLKVPVVLYAPIWGAYPENVQYKFVSPKSFARWMFL